MSSSRSEMPRAWRPENAGRPPVGPVWRREETTPVARRRQSYFRKVIAALIIFALCCGIFVWLSMWLTPAKDTDIVLIGAGYQQNLAVPQNVFGWKSLANLAKVAEHSQGSALWEAGRLRLVRNPRLFIDTKTWDRDLLNIKGRNAIVFFSVHGGADENGAYLLTQNAYQTLDADGDDIGSKLRLTDVLDRLDQLSKRDKHIVLVLDVVRMRENWRLGMLENGFAYELKQLNQRIAEIPNLTVLCSTDEGERTWDSEIIQQSVFSYYFQEGIRGAAETAPADGQISLLELYDYLKRKVGQWAASNRDASQTPILLPQGKTGRERARRLFLTTVTNYQPAELTLVPYSPSEDLQQAWQTYVQTAQQNPMPTAYAPASWRIYQALLLRYEQLERAGDSDNALAVRMRLRELGQSITRVKQIALASGSNTLTMYAAQGIQPKRRHSLHPMLNQLWQAPTEKLAKTWTAIQKKAEADPQITKELDGLPFRSKMIELVLHRAAEAPAQNLARIGDLLQTLKDPFRPLPAEAHYTAMVIRDILQRQKAKIPVPTGFLRLALQVRLRAEEAALAVTDRLKAKVSPDAVAGYDYSEQVSPWIADLVTNADTHRRKGEDLLFATQSASWRTADQELQKAGELYENALKRAVMVQQSLRLRDEMFGILPYWGKWLAIRRTHDDRFDKGDPATYVKKFEGMCAKTFQLLQLLDAPMPAGSLKNALDDLTKLTADLKDEVVFWQKWAIAYRENLESVALASMWRKIDDALTVPFVDAEMRKKLLVDRSSIGRSLWQKFLNESAPAPAYQPPSEKQMQEIVRRRGRMALAILGKDWYNDGISAGHMKMESFDQTTHRLTTLAEQWRTSSLIAGNQIAMRWQRMTTTIRKPFVKQRLGQPPPTWDSLLKAERLSRSIDAVGAQAMTHNPAGVVRQTRIQKLLLSQTNRTYRNHWFSQDPQATPYYQVSGNRYMTDVQRFAKSPFTVPATEITQTTALLGSPNDVSVTLTGAPGLAPGALADPTLHMTSEREFPLSFELSAPSKSKEPSGYPVFWVETGPKLELQSRSLSPASKPNVRFDFFVEPGMKQPFSFVLESKWLQDMQKKPPLLATAVESSFDLRGYFRGQSIDVKTQIDLHPLAQNTLVTHPLPKRGSVAMQASKAVRNQFGEGGGNIVIVLDASGSMRPPSGTPFNKKTKFVEATSALRTVLAKIPSGTTVSLWVFGQAMGPEKTVNDVERTIKQLMPPTVWDASDAAKVDKWMKKFEYPEVEPWNESPIMRAMLTASQQDFANATGFKTLVVITDGMDNRFAKDKQANPQGKSIGTVLQEYFQSISVNIIGFKIVDAEMEKARQQFDAIEHLPIPGKFYNVHDSGALIQALQKSFQRTLNYWVDRENNQPVPNVPIGGLMITGDSGVDQWLPGGLSPGGYKFRLYANKRLTKSFALNWSDLLLVELAQDNRPGAPLGALAFQRVMYSMANYPFKPGKFNDNKTWRFAVLQNQTVNSGSQMLATLERSADPNVDVLQQIHPFKTWIEVSPTDMAAGFSQRWYFQPGYPAPAWSIDMPWWPSQAGTPSRPKVKVWWNPDQPPGASAEFERGHDFQRLTELRNRTKQIGSGQVVLESVTVEKRLVEIKPARVHKSAVHQTRDCLVIRMQYPAKQPVYVRAMGIAAAGSEHRLYQKAGKYTAIFWPVTSDQAEEYLSKIEIVSLPMFKQEAVKRKFTLSLDNIYAPQANETRPLPAVDLWDLTSPPPRMLPSPRAVSAWR